MTSLLTAKQISSLMKSKRKQFVESAVGLGKKFVPSTVAGESGSWQSRDTVVLVFNVKSLPNRALLQARKHFFDNGLKLRKVPNGVVKAAARDTPFIYMMTGPTVVATPLEGKTFSFNEIVDTARAIKDSDKIKGLLFTGMVHKNVFLTPKRLSEVDPEEVKKIPSLVALPMIQTLQTLQASQLPIIATLRANIAKKAQDGDEEAKKFIEAQ